MDSTPGHYGPYGGRYVAETLMPPLDELAEAWSRAWADPSFRADYERLLRDYVGRPTLAYKAERLGSELGAEIWLKREDLNHTGAHKINNCVGQILLARRMGKERVIAETGAGQHGVATATACALFGLECVVYMGAEDTVRQRLNVARMQLLGARVEPVHSGTSTLKDAMNEALRDWVTHVDGTFYCIGSVAGPHPYPEMVRELQACIGQEAKTQLAAAGVGLPRAIVACVGGGSNAMGIFDAFRHDAGVALYGVEAAGHGLDTNAHAASIQRGSVGVLHGQKTYLLQDAGGQVQPAHSISAGLDYPGVGPEHALLHDTGRATYIGVTDSEALEATRLLSRTEGIIPALESAHAIAALPRVVAEAGGPVLVNLSGRGDKDMETVARELALGGTA